MRRVPRFEQRCLFCGHHIQGVPVWDGARAFCDNKHRNLWCAGYKYRHWHHRWFIPLYLIAGAAAVAWGMHAAYGAPPAGSDPNSPDATYFRNLKQPDTGVGCCNVSDCHYWHGKWEIRDYHYWVLLNAGWTQVPDNKVIKPNTSPRGEVVLCYLDGQDTDQNGNLVLVERIFCFSPGLEA